MDARQKGAAAWPAGATFNTYHLIDVPATQPAGPVRLEARAYDTRTLEPILAGASKELRSVALSEASVTPPLAPVDAAAIQIDRLLPHKFASGIELLGTDPWPPTVNAGQTLPLKLYWRAGSALVNAAAVQRPPGRRWRQRRGTQRYRGQRRCRRPGDHARSGPPHLRRPAPSARPTRGQL